MSLVSDIYRYAADYLRLADPSQVELTVELSIQSGIAHAGTHTGYRFQKGTARVSLTVGQRYVRIVAKPARNIRIIDRNNSILQRFPDGSSSVDLSSVVCDCCSREGSATLVYDYGLDCFSDIPVPILLGILKYCAYIYENRGDQNQLNLRDLNSALTRSGALSEWRPYMRWVD